MRREKTVSVVAPDGVQLTDVAGPLDVFAEANNQAEKVIYRVEVLGMKRGPITSSSGIKLLPDRIVGSVESASPHTLLVAGAPHLTNFQPSRSAIEAITWEIKRSKRFGSVCTGAFLLAKTGKIDRRRVTTHWSVADTLASRHPTLKVEKDALFVRDGKVRTAAGVTAGMDLALALVAEDVGRDVAKAVASQLVMFFKRPGGQMQFSREGEVAPASRSTFQELQRWVAANPSEDHSVPRMAKRVGLSTRHFARIFRAETGLTPAAWVESARVEAARALLEGSDTSPKQVASRCGFADVNVLRRAFKRQVGVTPSEYSRRYR